MKALRFTDICANGFRPNGKRVFIRADLNVPQDDPTAPSPKTPASEPRMPCDPHGARCRCRRHGHLPPGSARWRGEFKPEDSLAPVAAAHGRTAWARNTLRMVSPWSPTGWTATVSVAAWPARAAGELPPEQGREEEQRRTGAGSSAALCDIFVHDAFGTAHRAEGFHLRHRPVPRKTASRRPPAGGRDGCHLHRPGPERVRRAAPRTRCPPGGEAVQPRRGDVLPGHWWRSWPAPRSPPSSPSCKSLAKPMSTSSSSVAALPTPLCWPPA